LADASRYGTGERCAAYKKVVITIENGQALAVLKKTEYDDTGSSDPDYFSHLNIKRAKSYNYKVLDLNAAQNGTIETIAALFSESDLISVSETDYLYDAGYKARHILHLPFEIRVMNPASPTQALSKNQTVFDEQNQYFSTLDLGSTVGYEAPSGTYAHLRGNATTHRTWFAEENRWLETHTQYDNFGNVRKVWDPSGDVTRFTEIEYSSQYYYAYPTKKITSAPDPTGVHGTSESSSASTTYDFWTALPVTLTNATGQVTSFEYDNLHRAKKIIPPAGGAITEKEYNDTPGNISVKTRTQVDANNWAESTTFFDNLGKVFKTQMKDVRGDIFSEV
jgi:YD repeat-containing protein